MKPALAAFAVIPLAMLLGGCATHTQSGALVGSGLGAATGAIIGHQFGKTGAGALVGGGLGALTGSVVGSGLDENDRRNRERFASASAAETRRMTVQDVLYMTESGVQEELIISSIRSSNSLFALSSADIVNLHNQGVSDRVIQAMLDAKYSAPTAATPPSVYYERRPVYHVVEPYHRPVVIGFGHHGGCW